MLKLSDVLLYPHGFYTKLTNKKASLYAGIIFVGFADLFLPDLFKTLKAMFIGKTPNQLIISIVLSVVTISILGLLDVVIFSFPLFDLFNFLKSKVGEAHNASVIKVIKVYIYSYFILLPLQLLLNYTVFKDFNASSSEPLQNLFALYFFIIALWSTAIVVRGINTLFNLNGLLRRVTFFIVFLWNMIVTIVFSYQIFPLIIKILQLAGISLPV